MQKNQIFSIYLCLTVIFLLIVNNSNYAQPVKQNFFWIGFGIGEGSVENFKGDMAVRLAASYQFNKNLLTVRFLQDGEFMLGGMVLNDYSLLYSRIFTSSAFFTSFGVGLGLIHGEEKSLFDENKKIKIRFGLPIETQLFWRPLRFIGLGLIGFGNINSKKSFYGYALSLQIGILR